jgi:hypothetical protein
MAKRVIIGVRIAILASAIAFVTMLGIAHEVMPYYAAKTINGVTYAPGRYPGDGRSK